MTGRADEAFRKLKQTGQRLWVPDDDQREPDT